MDNNPKEKKMTEQAKKSFALRLEESLKKKGFMVQTKEYAGLGMTLAIIPREKDVFISIDLMKNNINGRFIINQIMLLNPKNLNENDIIRYIEIILSAFKDATE